MYTIDFNENIDRTIDGVRDLFLQKYAEDVTYDELFDVIFESLRVHDVYPVALKTHGAWDGIDCIDNLPDDTLLYAFKF